MPQVLRLKNLGLKGLNTDVTPWELDQEFITHGINFRVFAGALKSAGGWENWAEPPANFNAGFLMYVGAVAADYWLIAGRDAVYAFNGQSWTDISSAAGYDGVGVDDELQWQGCRLGQIPIINNPQVHPEYWSPPSPGQILQPLNWSNGITWDEADKQCKVMRSHKNFLFALNMVESGIEQPDAYRWSHPADINGLPFTWDETDQSALAGRAALGGDGGQIIDGQSLRDAFCIYSESSIDLLTYTGDEFVWRRRELSATTGLLSRNCIVEIKGTHFLLADGDIVSNDGNGLNSLMHNRLRRRLTAQMNTDYYDRSFAVRNNALKEVWFCVPEDGAQYPNIAYIYNWKDGSWAIRDIPESTFAAYGPQNAPTETWDEWLGTWDTGKGVWGSRQRTPLDDTVVGIKQDDSSLKILDTIDSSDAGGINCVVERTDYPLLGHRQVTTITKIYPHIEGTEPVLIEFGSQDYAGAPVRWKPGVNFVPGIDRKVDIRTTGELHCWRLSSVGVGQWSLGGMDIEYEENGLR